jgi:hypothetical protein
MEASAYIGGVIVCLGYLIAGVRLWRLSVKTQQKPERLLSVALLLWGLAYVGWQVPLILSDESLLTPLYFSARILTDAGTVVSALFLRLVFRPNSGIAGVFVTVIAASVILGVTGSAWVGDWGALYPLRNLWWWLEWAAVILSVAWIGIEGFHHYGNAKLRHHLGLCDAIVCNRYLLWGFTGVGWAIYEAIYALQQIEFEVTGSYSAWMDAVASTLELIPIACIWLIFFPPNAYQRWVARSNPRSPIAAG